MVIIKTLISKISFILPMISIMLLSNACQSSDFENYQESPPFSAEIGNTLNIGVLELEFMSMNEGFTGWNNYVLEYGENVYYITHKGIMRWNKHSGSVLILSESDIGGMVVDGTWIYYYTTNGMEIFRTDLDGDYRESVFKTKMITNPIFEKQVCGFTVYQGVLYIKDTPISCFAYDMATGKQKHFNEDMSSGVFLNNKFYYVEHAQRTFSIFSMDIETGNTDLIRGDGISYDFEHPKESVMCDKLAVVNGSLFYTTRVDPSVYLYNDDGQDLLIEDFNSSDIDIMFVTMTADNRYLYYTHKDTNVLRRYDPDTNKAALVETPDDFSTNRSFGIIQNILYYRLEDGKFKAFVINIHEGEQGLKQAPSADL